MNDWYGVRNISEVDSPALLIYPDRVRENIRSALAMVGEVSRLRPHAKTHKSEDATLLQMEHGIRKFKCATIAEAEMLARSGAPDVLLAYQPVGPKVDRLMRLMLRFPGTQFSCLIDNADAARSLAGILSRASLELPVYIDLDIGMHRTGIPADTRARDLWMFCKELTGVRPVGLHAYDGHLRGGESEALRRTCDDAFIPVRSLARTLRDSSTQTVAIIAGGSPTFPFHAGRTDVECSPGTFIYWDWGYQQSCPDQPFIPAALVASRVISIVNASTYCVDLGHKAVAAENPITSRVRFLNAPGFRLKSQSEEHCVIEAEAGERLTVGDVLYGLPYHICPTCALYERGVTVRDGVAAGEWRMGARDRVISV